MLARKITSISVILFSFLACFFYPTISVSLFFVLLIYGAFLLKNKSNSLFFISAIIPLLNFAPWSGVVLFEEFDIFIFITLGFYIWANSDKKTQLSKLEVIVFAVFLSSIIISLFIGLYPFQKPAYNDLSSYLGSYNSLRIARSFLWATLLIPFWGAEFSTNYLSARRKFLSGVISGLVGTFVIVLWERGVLADIVSAENRYELLRNLLDFSSKYRITAFFSEMNTGGSAVDGYISMVWIFPLVCFLLWLGRLEWKNGIAVTQQTRRIFSGAVLLFFFLCGLYVAGTTFTRITYVALAVSAMFFLVMAFYQEHKKAKTDLIATSIFVFLMLLNACTYSFFYSKGGGLAVAAIAIAAMLSIPLGLIKTSLLRLPLPVLCLILLFGSLSFKAMVSSKWVDNPFFFSALYSFLGTFILVGSIVAALRFYRGRGKGAELVKYLIPLLLVLAVAVFASSGNRMKVRFSSVDTDTETRFSHWSNVYDAMDSSTSAFLFGMGLGQFPKIFIERDEQSSGIGTYEYIEEGEDVFLRLNGGKDLEIGQRIYPDNEIPVEYLLSFRARAFGADPKLSFRICHRNLMHASDCRYFSVKFDEAKQENWQIFEIPVKEKILERYNVFTRWPQVLLFRNFKKGTFIEIDNVSLSEDSINNILNNGDFQKGGHNWFSYNEFEHLPWHTKNLWLHLFFEQGLFGVLSFALLTLFSVKNGLAGVAKGDIFAVGLVSAVIGFHVIGLTGSLLDAPRIAFFYYFILLILLTCRWDLSSRPGNLRRKVV